MPTLKPVRWIGSSREDLQGFPTAARRNIGYALHFAQVGDKHPASQAAARIRECRGPRNCGRSRWQYVSCCLYSTLR
jgi:phage-related protein